jgi:FtsP/CotA-like multicopper oxidase with cupredoxin domain
MPSFRPTWLLATLLLCAAPPTLCADHGASYRIAERRIAAKPPTLRVSAGDVVTIDWRTDETVRLHLHGYDIELTVQPSAPGQMRLLAHTPGRYPLSAHGFGAAAGAHAGGHAETTLMYLEVLPR